MSPAAPATVPAPTGTPTSVPASRSSGPVSPSPLMRDALVTISTRFGLAVLIFGTDIALARLLGPAAKGRFALVLLYSQLAALVVGWGTDQALAVVSGRDRATARHGFANALVWTAIVGGAAVIGSVWLFGAPGDGPATGPLASLIPNLSGTQFMFAAVAIPGELFFGLGLFALLGRKRVIPYNLTRVIRRAVLLLMILWVAATDGIVGGSPSMTLLNEELRFGTKALPGSLAERLQFRADSFLINIILGVRQTGIYSVTSGLAETLWYVPNALGTVMFSRAVDPKADAGRVASVLTRTTLAVALATAVPAFIFGPRLVRAVYGTQFADAGVALRLILPGIVAYSVVAVLSRYITGRGRPGTGTLILVGGLAVNITINLVLIPRYGIAGAAAASSVSYLVTAILTLVVFIRLSGRGLIETLVIRRSDMVALFGAFRAIAGRIRGSRTGPLVGLRGGDSAASQIMDEHDPGEEL